MIVLVLSVDSTHFSHTKLTGNLVTLPLPTISKYKNSTLQPCKGYSLLYQPFNYVFILFSFTNGAKDQYFDDFFLQIKIKKIQTKISFVKHLKNISSKIQKLFIIGSLIKHIRSSDLQVAWPPFGLSLLVLGFHSWGFSLAGVRPLFRRVFSGISSRTAEARVR